MLGKRPNWKRQTLAGVALFVWAVVRRLFWWSGWLGFGLIAAMNAERGLFPWNARYTYYTAWSCQLMAAQIHRAVRTGRLRDVPKRVPGASVSRGQRLHVRCPETGANYIWFARPRTIGAVERVWLVCPGWHRTITWKGPLKGSPRVGFFWIAYGPSGPTYVRPKGTPPLPVGPWRSYHWDCF